MKVVIIGGVAGGATAAARIRRLDEAAQIVMLERTGFVSYANCGLPYYVGGVITDEEDLTLQTPQGFWERYRIEVRVHHEALSLDPVRKVVRVRDGAGREYEETYDKLLLSPGAKPLVPDLPGIGSGRVFVLRTVEDTLRIARFLESDRPARAVVVGGGFIGLETAENLLARGLRVTLMQRGGQVLAPLDYDMACHVHNELRARGLTLLLESAVTGFREENGEITVLTEGGCRIGADMVVFAAGVLPDTKLAQEAGLRTGAKGSIAVDEHMRTSAPDVYAVGDAVEILHTVTQKPSLVSLAGPANKQARIAADNICGTESRYRGAQGTFVIKLFGMTAAATGIGERTAQAEGISYEKIVLSPLSHAGYYPNASALLMKVLYEKGTLRLLGAQILGYEGVDKRIDVLATAMRAGMPVTALSELDLAYAPPYGSAKDPVNYAGYIAEDLERGLARQLHWEELPALPRDGSVYLLDARTPGEYRAGHAEGFVNVPLDTLRTWQGETQKPVYVMCQSGLRSYLACRILAQRGYTCYNFSGGYRFLAGIERAKRLARNTRACGMETEER